MKRYLQFKYAWIILFLGISSQVSAQVLSEFTVRQSGKNVELKWTFNSGETCDGTWVKHGTDTTEMETVEHVPGICGAPDQEVSYSFVHEMPVKNDTNYYSLKLGNRGNSSVIKVFVTILKDGFVINGNPLYDNAEIILSEDYQQGVEISIFNMKGRKQYQAETTSQKFSLNRADFNKGMHIVIVRYNNGEVYRRKLMVM